jgi:hypothetical protein
MTHQQALDQVWDHFIVGQAPPGLEPSRDGEFMCWYRTPNGCRCAVGVLIPDEQWNDKYEDLEVWELREVLSDLFGNLDTDFLELLQECHDLAAFDANEADDLTLFLPNLKLRLTNLAYEWDLTVSEAPL